MREDHDDTVIAPPRAPATPTTPDATAPDTTAPDTDDTVIPLPTTGRPATAHAAGESAGRPAVAAASPSAASSHYRFRIGEHSEPIPLDVPCYIGRRPSSPRVVSGTGPRLVRVPSPRSEVSATHLEVRQLGASVIVTDLRSTNGSVVMLPGSVPRKLRQGESVVVSPGTLVDIGDDNILQILPMQRPA